MRVFICFELLPRVIILKLSAGNRTRQSKFSSGSCDTMKFSIHLNGMYFAGGIYRQLFVLLFLVFCIHLSTNRVVRAGTSGITTRRYNFVVNYATFTRLNHTKRMIVVNGQFPGPAIRANEDDIVIVNVTNLVAAPVTIHWHGVKQIRTCWADGVPYITMCPLQQNQSFSHRFQLLNQTGTMWYHAHISWLRASVHGPIVLRPRKFESFPFTSPKREITIMIGEWWNNDVEDVLAYALARGGRYNISDAITLNGQPGFLYNHSSKDALKVKVTHGETYLLRVVNACLNFGMFFGVANHSLKVVQLDSAYVKPFTVNTVLIAPGQTLDALLTANRASGRYYMAASPYSVPDPQYVPFPEIPATARMEYEESSYEIERSSSEIVTYMPTFPSPNDSNYRHKFDDLQKSINTTYQTLDVPETVDKHLFFTVGYGLDKSSSCHPFKTCVDGYDGQYRVVGSVNNISFVTPNTTSKSLLEIAYLRDHGNASVTSALDLDFPSQPTMTFNYTGSTRLPLSQWFSKHATKLSVINYNASVQIILQNTNIVQFETHPFHLHGYSFYIVGRGNGNYDPDSSPATFNLVDPPLRNTFGVPHRGWLALRFRADNPGVWLFHCHFEIHTSWGMETVLYVKEGTGTNQTLEAPPSDLPACASSENTSKKKEPTVSITISEDITKPEISKEVPH
ncbi:laccase-4 isoform X1 [Physcomitrium patens]|uniref:laccase-4 isoform X1 n=1 Tax=Physcomitrium patens TaxID=3218 RepID=UPI000D177AF7|nr:laccase-4-like isoform X1 [Physcomitrium patens]|eukprot:XP_024397494.1 laccase-4-like isoform X1 [Physcomitrella patens]